MKEGIDEEPGQMDFDDATFGKLMGEIFKIKGYKASAIVTTAGELLFSNATVNNAGNHTSWSAVFNRLFNHTCHLSETTGFVGCDQVTMRTGDEILAIRSSAKDCLVGVRLMVIFDHFGNEAMINLKLEKLLPQLMHCLTWDPENLVRLYLKDMQRIPDSECAPITENGSIN
jgi:hypothetical protein